MMLSELNKVKTLIKLLHSVIAREATLLVVLTSQALSKAGLICRFLLRGSSLAAGARRA